MNLVTLFVAVLLAAMWIIALAVNAAAAWFTWLVFAAAILLLLGSAGHAALYRRQTGHFF